MTSVPADAAAGDFFEKEIRPVLAGSCQQCHGAKKQEGSLRLDTREGLMKGGDTGPAIVPGDPAKSLLLSAIRQDGELKMPPRKRLTKEQVAAFTRWVELGAPWPAARNQSIRPAAHWAFQPVRQPPIPAVRAADWCQTSVDAFVRAKLEAAGLPPSPPADRRTLLRRLSYDLTGLPPSTQAVEDFLADGRPDAVDRVIDRLLDSPHYGEQWARHWLDVARYSDTKGYVYAREERFWVHAWPYRDWVVSALNRDIPYDRFLLLQLAADQVAPGDPPTQAAMGFLTLGRRFLGVTHDIIDDRIDVVTRGTLGLTVACARCHDHKYDPIPTRDYYSLYGVFANCVERMIPATSDSIPAGPFAQQLAERQKALAEGIATHYTEAADRVRARVADYLLAQTELQKYPEEGFDQVLEPGDIIPQFVRRWRDYLDRAERDRDAIFVAWRAYLALPKADFASRAPVVTKELARLPATAIHPQVRAAFAMPPADLPDVARRYGELFTRIDKQWRAELESAKQAKAAVPKGLADPAAEGLRQVLYGKLAPCEVPDEPIVSTEIFVPTSVCNHLWKLQGDVDRLLIQTPAAPPFAVTLVDRPLVKNSRILKRGNAAMLGEMVPRQFLEVLAGPNRKPFQHGSGRLELAQAIIDPTNPLTARVLVNRVWAYHFGAGLVKTPSDFGTRAEPPSHPELLDWLASRFIADGWSIKSLHRLILRSATYQQSSAGPADPAVLSKAQGIDPENRLLWRANPRRLSLEETRDGLLATAGGLNTQIGGKPFDLFVHPYLGRRTLYGLVDREYFPAILRAFDFANPDLHVPWRSETTVPQQALFFLNHPAMLAASDSFARRAAPKSDPEARIRQMFQAVYLRSPNPEEMAQALAFIQSATQEADEHSTPLPRPEWHYGHGEWSEAERRIKAFATLPHFTGAAWQGGPKWPDAQLGWARLTADGGHPGNDAAHAVVRRWVAPRATTIRVASTARHVAPVGDGVFLRLASSRQGLVAAMPLVRGSAEVNVPEVSVRAGDVLDFIVDRRDDLNSDDFEWRVQVFEVAPKFTRVEAWDSVRDFAGPGVPKLDPWQQLAQVLLMSNEFVMLD